MRVSPLWLLSNTWMPKMSPFLTNPPTNSQTKRCKLTHHVYITRQPSSTHLVTLEPWWPPVCALSRRSCASSTIHYTSLCHRRESFQYPQPTHWKLPRQRLPTTRHKCSACYKQVEKKEHLIEHLKISNHSVHQPACKVCQKHCKFFSLRGCQLCLGLFDSPRVPHFSQEKPCVGPKRIANLPR